MASQQELQKRAEQYCFRNECILSSDRTFGSGVHGSVFPILRTTSPMKTALKIHHREVSYHRERDVYLRLQEFDIQEIEGHHVPQLIQFDDQFLAIEMSVVVRPYILDFGGAYLDETPDFDAEIIEQWEQEKEEQFENNWPKASSILAHLSRFGIYVVDVNPYNIAFAEKGES